MKFIYFIIFLLPITIFGQVTITGKVTDKTNLAISYVDIVVKRDSSVFAHTITDSSGRYRVKLPNPGRYNFIYQEITSLGKKMTVDVLNDTLINVTLDSSSIELGELVITAKNNLIERKSDRYVVNVANSIGAEGSDAFSLIGKTPGVRTSAKQISLVGKNEVIVTIDDKVLQLSADEVIDLLKTIPSSDVSQIEVITNPSAQYESQGSSGILNIKLKKNIKKGYGGVANLNYKLHKYSNYGTNTNLSYNSGKWSLNASLALAMGKDYLQQNISTFYPTQSWIIKNTSGNKIQKLNSTVDVQYLLSEKTKVNVSYLGTYDDSKKSSSARTNIYNAANYLDSIQNTSDAIKANTQKTSVNIRLNHSFDKSKLLVEGDWLNRGGDKFQDLIGKKYDNQDVLMPNSLFQVNSKTGLFVDAYTLNSVFSIPINDYEWAIGGKAIFIDLKTNSSIFYKVNDTYILDPSQSPVSSYTENRQAIFTNLKKSTEKWKYQAGLRFEYTQTSGITRTTTEKSFSNTYPQLFPSVNIGYTINNNSNFDLTYGRRINRPRFRLLDPFRLYYTQYDYWEGNPFLKPSITNNLDVSYTYTIFTTTASYSTTKDNFEQLTVFKPNNVVSHVALNYMNSNSYQVMLSTALDKWEWFETNVQLQGFYNEYISKIDAVKDNKIWGWYFMINNQFQLNKSKTISAEVNFWYQSPKIDLEAVYERQYSLDVGMKFLLPSKNLSLSLNVFDLLQSNFERFSTNVSGIRQNFYNYYEPRSFRASLQYKFGNKKIKYVKPETAGEERDRS